MKIVSSSVIEDAVQVDGRRAIRELHVDDSGGGHYATYLAEAKESVEGILSVRAQQIVDSFDASAILKEEFEAAEKERAIALLELPDEKIQAILMLKAEEVAATKAELEKKSE